MRRLKGTKEGGLQRDARWRLDLLLLLFIAAFDDVSVLQSIDVIFIV
jgi:hypothetical protein